jgi:hypothetical protein
MRSIKNRENLAQSKGCTMKLRTLILAAALAVPASQAFAGGSSLSGDQLRHAISNKTVYLKISGFEIPIRYSSDGHMKGTLGTVAASFASGNGAQDYGKWWVKNDQLCQKWTSWMDGDTYCYRLTKSGSTVHWTRNDGRSGTARIGG